MPTRKTDPRALGSLCYQDLAKHSPRSCTALMWIRACGVIRREDLIRVTWPDISRRQTHAYGLSQMLNAHLLQSVDEQRRVFKLGRRGAQILLGTGMPSAYRKPPSERVLPGLLLASAFATGLGRGLMEQPHVAGVSWAADPFAGARLRPDSVGAIRYGPARFERPPLHKSLLEAEQPWWLARGESVLRLYLEIDRVTQSIEQLTERIESWRAGLPYLASELPYPTEMVVLWVTSGSWRRAHTLARLWRERMAQAALCTTEFELRDKSELRPMNPFDATWITGAGTPVSGWQVFRCDAQ